MGSYGAFVDEARRLADILFNDPVSWRQYLQKPIKGEVMFKHDLGATVKEVISGFEGIVTGRVQYLTGCYQYLVTSRKPDTKPIWYDEDRLVSKKVKLFSLSKRNDGPDMQAPTK